MQLAAIGWETADKSYHWNGMHRQAGEVAIFQYTLSGQGIIRYGNREYIVPEKCGFFCTVPSVHSYFFDSAHGYWEFLFIVVRGEDALRNWTSIIDTLGPVVSFEDQAEPITCISELFGELCEFPDMDNYKVSTELYRFYVEMQRIAESDSLPTFHDSSTPIQDAVRLMQTQYALPLSLDEIAYHVGLSKSHFCRLFQEKTNYRPFQFLSKIRIEKASILLRQTNKTIEVIARMTGFESSNYFIRLFKSVIGMTPNQFRQLSHSELKTIHIDYLHGDSLQLTEPVQPLEHEIESKLGIE